MRYKSLVRKLTGTFGAFSLSLAAVGGAAACSVPPPQPLTCSVVVSPATTLINGSETVTVKTVPGALVTTSVRYPGTGGSVKSLKANSKGIARTTYTSGTRSGKVPVVALVARGASARQCSTSFTVANGSVFTLTQKPACPEGTAVVRAPAVPAVVSWRVTGATGVTLSVDGPGIYASYGPNGSQAFNFGCGGPVGSTETHTYTLTTIGGVTVSKTISVSAVVRDNGGGAGLPPPTG
jgi:hypothetical protein